MIRRGFDIFDTKTLSVIPDTEGTSKLRPTVCGHPFRNTIAHEPVVVNSTSHGIGTFKNVSGMGVNSAALVKQSTIRHMKACPMRSVERVALVRPALPFTGCALT